MTQPIFTSVGEGVECSIKTSPTLVDDGSSLDIVISASHNAEILKNVVLNGKVIASNVKSTVLKLTNINSPKFITVSTDLLSNIINNPSSSTSISSTSRDILPSSSREPLDITGTTDACCGIRSVRLSLQEDGAVVGTVTGLRDDVYAIMDFVMSGAPVALSSTESKYRITSWREDGPITTVSAMSTVSDSYEKIETSAIFKTVPQEIYDMHVSGIIPNSIQNPLDSPDSTIYIRASDIYGTDGWTVQEILDTLGIDANIPSGFNYHVYQLSVTRGAPIISLLHNLLPIPGLVIERRNTAITSSNTRAAYYITIAKGVGGFGGTTCKEVSNSSKSVVYAPTIIGTLGEPRYIEEPKQPDETEQLKYTCNLVKGVFSVDKSIVISDNATIVPNVMTPFE